MKAEATNLICPDETERQQRYRAALEGKDLSTIPDSIASEFIQGNAGRIEVMEGHAQVTAHLTESLTNDAGLDTSIHGVSMGLFLTLNWLQKSQERLADFETVRTRMRKEANE